MMPLMARKRHPVVEERLRKLEKWAETAPINRMEMHDKKIGVICSGISYQYAREALGEKASYLKLGMQFPLPEKLIRDFAAQVETLYVLEELEPFVENHCKALGLNVKGKDTFPICGEFSQTLVRERILGTPVETMSIDEELPARPPVMCPGCSHRGVFYALKRLPVFVSGDIGCYTLGATPPLSAMDTQTCMGGCIPGAHGFDKAGRPGGLIPVAVVGDSTFAHSGVTGLMNVAYNKANCLTIILDNNTTGMTGHQENPTTGITLQRGPSMKMDIEGVCRALGINRVRTVDPYDLPATYEAIKEELDSTEPTVIIAKRECALLKRAKPGKVLSVDANKCNGCRACLAIGCPATSQDVQTKKIVIDQERCFGCGQCVTLCRPGAIV
jgi:indolepyruvate ferredoxin oxidoreductase alpha subunit